MDIKPSLNSARFISRLEEVVEPEKQPGWATKLQTVCEELWAHLGREKADAEEAALLVTVLSNPVNFELAQLVIPELRNEEPADPNSPSQKSILDRTRTMRERLYDLESKTQDHFDDPLYREEKDVFADAEMYRAGLLLYNTGRLSEEQSHAVRDWVDRRPGVESNRQ